MHLERLVRPWATDGADILDSLVMETRDRLINLGVFAAAAVVWVLVGARRHDPRPGRRSERPGSSARR